MNELIGTWKITAFEDRKGYLVQNTSPAAMLAPASSS